MTGIFKYIVATSVCCLLLSCGGHKADSNASEDYYFDEDSAVVIEAVEAYIDDTDFVMADTCLDFEYDYADYDYYVEEAPVYNETPVHNYDQQYYEPQSITTPKESLQAKKEKLQERTEALYNQYKSLLDEYYVIGVFYNIKDHQIVTLVKLSDLRAASNEELDFLGKNIAMRVRMSVYKDRLNGGGDDEDAKLLHELNPKFIISIADDNRKHERFEYSIEETYYKNFKDNVPE